MKGKDKFPRKDLDELEDGIKSLDVLQITSKSTLGSIILNTSGIVINNWIRILGHGSNINRGILSYNSIGENGVAMKIVKILNSIRLY